MRPLALPPSFLRQVLGLLPKGTGGGAAPTPSTVKSFFFGGGGGAGPFLTAAVTGLAEGLSTTLPGPPFSLFEIPYF
jgi:hypothetical protein